MSPSSPVNNLDASLIASLAAKHPPPEGVVYGYGTAGFRTKAAVLDSVLFRVGILAVLRSKKLEGKAIGVMVTASHNPEEDNGVKLVDPTGDMLEPSWEPHATIMANTPLSALPQYLSQLVQTLKIDLAHPAHIIIARDTRPSGPALVAALKDGIDAAGGAKVDDRELGTTPVLHYLVRAVNTEGTQEAYGEPTVEGYTDKMVKAFATLNEGKPALGPLLVDCANGIGAPALESLSAALRAASAPLVLKSVNADVTPGLGKLNNACGADFVKTRQALPGGVSPPPLQRCASLDGDADRIVYYYVDPRGTFRLLDGDKIASLLAVWIIELVEKAGLQEQARVGVVQTAYANGCSSKFIRSQNVPIKVVSTGVKHLHHAAQQFSIGIYFEANGHGTVLFSPEFQHLLSTTSPSTPAQQTALAHLLSLTRLSNQTVGDALSDLLLVESVLLHKQWGPAEWDALYEDFPNRLVKVLVPDRTAFETTDAERRLVKPVGLQDRVDELVGKYADGRSFVRPSGTEDCVRVYAEAARRGQADELAFKVAGLVYDIAGGDALTRPREFL